MMRRDDALINEHGIRRTRIEQVYPNQLNACAPCVQWAHACGSRVRLDLRSADTATEMVIVVIDYGSYASSI